MGKRKDNIEVKLNATFEHVRTRQLSDGKYHAEIDIHWTGKEDGDDDLQKLIIKALSQYENNFQTEVNYNGCSIYDCARKYIQISTSY